MSNDKVTLYHFTNEEALTDILLDGEIRPSGKSLDRKGDDIWPAHNAPDIVWMTTDPTPGWCCERFRSDTPPYEVRFTLRLPAHEVNDLWTWATHHKVYPDSAELRPSSADEGSRFRCIERPVLAHIEWAGIHHMHRDGLCPGPSWAKTDTPMHREQFATQQALRASFMTPQKTLQGVEILTQLLERLRSESRRAWGDPASSKESQ